MQVANFLRSYRFRQIHANLSQLGILFNQVELLSGGINSHVLKLTTTDNKYFVLKIYQPPSLSDNRDRQQREKEFMMYIRRTHTYNIPRIIHTNSNQSWTLLSWVNGESVRNIDEFNISQICSFIESINLDHYRQDALVLHKASEALCNRSSFIEMTWNKYESIGKLISTASLHNDVYSWFEDSLKQNLKLNINRLLESNDCLWNLSQKNAIASPSDIGIHNIINNNGKFYFIDFEYGGLDNISKLICDLVLQPRFRLNEHIERAFLKNIENSCIVKRDKYWYDRYIVLKPLIQIRWILIMTKSMLNGQLTTFENIKNYSTYI